MNRLAILTAFHGDVKAHYAYSLAHLMQQLARTRPDLEVRLLMQTSAYLPKVRTDLAEQAIGWRADHLLWIDSDHLFPPDSADRLLAHDLDVVGANYRRRDPPHLAVALAPDGQPCPTTRAKMEARLVEPVRAMGFGLLLMRARVFGLFARPWFEVRDLVPGLLGEDGYFFQKLGTHGVVPHVDHALSWEVGHLAEVVVSFQAE